MKPLSTDIQKKIIYLPGINITIPFIFLYNCLFLKNPMKVLPTALMIIITSFLPFEICALFIVKAYPSITEVVEFINAYLISLVIGYRLVKYQATISN